MAAANLSENIVKINSKLLEAAELKKLDKLEKEYLLFNHGAVKDIRVQLGDQLKCLDNRLELQQGIVSEFQDVFRRRAEIENNYSKELEKLAKLISNRNKEHRPKRDGWQLFSSMGVWEQLMSQTKRASRDHMALSEIYLTQIVPRCSTINDDLLRMHRKCRDIGYEIHEEVLKILHELHTAMKTHQTYQSEFRQAENKLGHAEKQRDKLLQSVPPEKRERHKRVRVLEKEYLKRKQKYDDARLKATKARNEYLLCMDSANASIRKYFVDDLFDLIDCMDFGFHQSLHRAIMMHSTGQDQIRRSLQSDIDGLAKALSGLDSRLDKQRFVENNNAAFMIPKKFEFNSVSRNESETLNQKCILDELECRKIKLQERLTSLRAESEEIWKSMEEAERNLSEIVGAKDYDTTRFFVEDDRMSNREPESILQKQKQDRIEIEEFYTNKFREYVLNSNRLARLQAKYDRIRMTLGDQAIHASDPGTMQRKSNASRRRIGRTPRQNGVQPKLFCGSLEEYLEETGQDIPTIIKSCVRLINLYGLHHHGIFRVSGSQLEIANFRDAFERGEDPLADMTDASDINSVAGVLKLYFRELREPIFPIIYFDQFMEFAKLESKHEFVVKVRDLVKAWPRPVFIVMRYLFAFLNHLSEYSDENMMDPYNLAICFGPTLVPIPDDRDQVQYQNFVNELIKNFIIFHEDIFPSSSPGTTYEKYLTFEPDDMGDSPVDNSQDDLESDVAEDDSVFRESSEREDFRDFSIDFLGKSELLEAQALYDFCARSPREVNFNKGDTITLFKQVSNDWWKGSVNGKEGLIPDKYIMLKIRGEDERERLESCRSIDDSSVRERSGSATNDGSRSRASSSSDNQQRLGQPSPSPVSKRRSRPSSTSATSSVGGLGSSSSPVSSPGSLRASRNSVTSYTSASKKISPKSSTSMATPPSPPVTSTVIAVTGRRMSRDSIPTSPPASLTRRRSSTTMPAELPLNPSFLHPAVAEAPDSLEPEARSHTHIIRVSGPAPAPATASIEVDRVSLRERSTSETLGPRCRMPVSPSMEKELGESTGSSDSIISTGSNQELQSQLDSTLAEVEALTDHLERQKLSPSAESDEMLATSSTAPMPTVRRRTSGGECTQSKLPQPQPRSLPRPSKEDSSERKPSPNSKDEGRVILRQSSWASREQIALIVEPEDPTSRCTSSSAGGGGAPNGGIFAKNRNLWERRASSQSQTGASDDANATGSDDNGNAVKAGFRSNRDFWEQRVTMRQKQTPDLVLDLPVNTLSTSPSHVLSSSSSDGANNIQTASSAPVPKPRPRPSMEGSRSPDGDNLNAKVQTGGKSNNGTSSGDENVADQFAKSDRNTLKKLRQETKNEGDPDGARSGVVYNARVLPTVNKTSQK